MSLVVTPQMDPDCYMKMFLTLKAYREAGGLRKMTEKQLEDMPKEVMIALAPNEIAHVWNKLPNHIKNDIDMVKYQFCNEHYNKNSLDAHENDGPIPRKFFCCYCNVSDVKITTKTPKEIRRSRSIPNPLNCCKQQ